MSSPSRYPNHSFRSILISGIVSFLWISCAPGAGTPGHTATSSPVPPSAAATATFTPQPPTLTPQPATSTPVPSPSESATLPPTSSQTLTLTATHIGESTFEGVRVNFITNAGFLVTVGDRRVLIDGIYAGYPGGVLKPILDSQPPFDGIDLVLATHEHHDHFDPELVCQYLQENPQTVFASNPNAVDALLALDESLHPRLVALEPAPREQVEHTVAGIEIEAIPLSDGMPGILNLGFLITMGEFTFFHVGDMDPSIADLSYLQRYNLPNRQIDIAFLHEYIFSEEGFRSLITDGIQARYLVPMHFGLQPPADLKNSFSNLILFEEPYQSWIMP